MVGTLLIVALVVVIAIYVIVSIRKKQEGRNENLFEFKPYSQRVFLKDLQEFLKHMAKMLIAFVILLGWIIHYIYDVFREWIMWLRSNNEQKKRSASQNKSKAQKK